MALWTLFDDDHAFFALIRAETAFEARMVLREDMPWTDRLTIKVKPIEPEGEPGFILGRVWA